VADAAMKDPWTLFGSGVADCMDNSCMYAKKDGGMRTNGGCRCDKCPTCGAFIRPGRPHRDWCPASDWIPPHLRLLALEATHIPEDPEATAPRPQEPPASS